MGFSLNKLEGNATQRLASYTKNLTYEQIPEEVVERAKMIVMHTIGAALASKDTDIAKRAVALGKVVNGGEGGGATLWTDGSKVSAANAAFVNGTLSDILDWEDCSWTGHSAAGVVPVAWAVAEENHKSGKELITAIVAGYDVYQRVAMVVQPPAGWDYFKGWGLTTWQIFACSTPAAKLLDLTENQINQAFGVSAVNTPIPSVLHHATMSDGYHFEHGFRAKDGVMAALLAESGVENYMEAFDDPYAFHYHLTSNPRPEWYTKELGETHYIMSTLCKHWPANMWIQTPLEIIYNLITENEIHAQDIETVIIDPPTQGRMTVNPEGYLSITQAQFSTPFVIASMIYDPHPGPQWYAKERLTDKNILELAQKIKPGTGRPHQLEESFDLFKKGSHPKKTVTIITKEGKHYQGTMDCHPGHPSNMMSREQFRERFLLQAGFVMDQQKAAAVADILCNLENVADIADIHQVLHQ